MTHPTAASSEITPAKPVVPAVELMPNYFWHLMACANSWDLPESGYARQHGCLVAAGDADFLHRQRQLLVWGNGQVAALTNLLFFLPFAQPIGREAYLDYLRETGRCMAAPSGPAWAALARRYLPQVQEPLEVPQFSPTEAVVWQEITRIFHDNLAVYEQELWPDTAADLANLGLELTRRMPPGIIEAWEARLGLDFAADCFSPVLTRANSIDPLPSANNLSLSRNNFGLNASRLDQVADLVIHEIGIFTFMPLLRRLMSDPHYQQARYRQSGAVWQACEAMAEFHKQAIAGPVSNWQGTMLCGARLDIQWFVDWYAAHQAGDLETTLRQAIEAWADQY